MVRPVSLPHHTYDARAYSIKRRLVAEVVDRPTLIDAVSAMYDRIVAVRGTPNLFLITRKTFDTGYSRVSMVKQFNNFKDLLGLVVTDPDRARSRGFE